jgi:hypothetical protein
MLVQLLSTKGHFAPDAVTMRGLKQAGLGFGLGSPAEQSEKSFV